MEQIKYFLAANSCDGFVSYFDKCYNPKEGWRAFIIKGGPGTGKSSFMKKTAKIAEEKGYAPHLCPCSSDPDSLDAVIIPELKIVIMDGTSPHIVDPKYAGAVETVLNFGDFWDSEMLILKRDDIIKLTDNNKAFHKTASAFLKSSGLLLKENRAISKMSLNEEKAEKYAQKLCRRYLGKNGHKPKESVYFLSGVSPKGIISFEETVYKYSKAPIIINDDLGCASSFILNRVKEKALENGFEIIIFKNPFLPDITEHLIIPQLGLAFLRESRYLKFSSDARRIHAERFMDDVTLSKKVKLNLKTARMLISFAEEALKKAKALHDDLEALYIDAMDYKKLNEFTESFMKQLFE